MSSINPLIVSFDENNHTENVNQLVKCLKHKHAGFFKENFSKITFVIETPEKKIEESVIVNWNSTEKNFEILLLLWYFSSFLGSAIFLMNSALRYIVRSFLGKEIYNDILNNPKTEHVIAKELFTKNTKISLRFNSNVVIISNV